MMNNFRLETLILACLLPLSLLLTGCGSSSQSKTPAPVIQPTQTVKTPVITSKQVDTNKSTHTPPIKTEANVEVSALPANKPVITEIPTNTPAVSVNTDIIKQAQKNLRKVVVLLPDRPSLGDVNRDIEKGIRSAHQQHPHNPNLQFVFLYDALTGEALIQKANAHNPDWIIGPLTKSDIQSIQQLTHERHIFLNRLDNSTISLQIGLPLEDEVDQLLSQFAPQLGQLLVIATQDTSDQRLLNYLTHQAKTLSLNLNVITVEKQNPDMRDWLNREGGIQSSQERIKRMSNLVRGDFSDSTPQARQDIQAIIFLGNAKQLRSIMPSLSYHRLNWPVYATSRLLPSKNTDIFNEPELNGVTLLTPPYLLNTQTPNTLFEALGWDSYQLLANPFAHAAMTQTGKLVNQDNQLRRQLLWGQIQGGRLIARQQP
jgi:outer membrane PBP1 activator LpoA protein